MIADLFRTIRRDRGYAQLVFFVTFTVAALFGLALLAVWRDHPNRLFYFAADRGYAEFVQYLMYVWVIGMLGWHAVTRRRWAVVAWIPLFFVMLYDDAMRVHERHAFDVTGWMTEPEMFGISRQNLGELIIFAGLGGAALLPVVIVYWFLDRYTRTIFHTMFLLLVFLGLFVVVADALHPFIVQERIGDPMTFVEDGGEVIVVALFVLFVAYLNITDGPVEDDHDPAGEEDERAES